MKKNFFHKKQLYKLCYTISLITCSSVLPLTLHAQQVEENLLDMSLEDLMNIEVTSVSKRAQSIANAPAAIYVITAEDIKRSGASTIPDALRMVPGLHVSQQDANKWSISARGFGSRFANKLLVLMDGRAIYTPSFSGTYWENQDVVLRDIDRIEVIRGPGATLWGSNAVNGVINIMTKSAQNTQGNMISTHLSSIGETVGSWRYGGQLNENVFYRVYGKYQKSAEFASSSLTGDAEDEMNIRRAGFRVDGEVNSKSKFTFQGEVFEADIDQLRFDEDPRSPQFLQYQKDPIDEDGLNLLARWTFNQDNGGIFSAKLYYDFFDRVEQTQDETRKTYDFDFQYQAPKLANHQFVVGGGYRWDDHDTRKTSILELRPAHVTSERTNFFMQDEISLFNDRLGITLGSKFEWTNYSPDKLDVQPSIRFSFILNENHSVWGAASKALRTYSRIEQEGNIVGDFFAQGIPGIPLPVVIKARSDSILDPEEILVYELGYRGRLANNLTMDLSLFKNDYEELSSLELQGAPQFMGTYVVFDSIYGTDSDGDSYGLELALDWKVSRTWHIKSSYSFIELDIDYGGQFDVGGRAPKNQFNLRSQHQLSESLSLDLGVYFVDDVEGAEIKDYTRFDVRLGWNPSDNLELSVVGSNLLDDQHHEFLPQLIESEQAEVKRSVALDLIWSF